MEVLAGRKEGRNYEHEQKQMDGSTSTSNNGGEITVNNGDLPSKCNTYLMFEGNSYMLPVVISMKGTKTKTCWGVHELSHPLFMLKTTILCS